MTGWMLSKGGMKVAIDHYFVRNRRPASNVQPKAGLTGKLLSCSILRGSGGLKSGF